jgi:hypothetical protein
LAFDLPNNSGAYNTGYGNPIHIDRGRMTPAPLGTRKPGCLDGRAAEVPCDHRQLERRRQQRRRLVALLRATASSPATTATTARVLSRTG